MGLHRVNTSELIRGAARFMVADSTQAKPAALNDVIMMFAQNQEYEVEITGTPTGGTFDTDIYEADGTTLIGSANGVAYNATAGAYQTALEAVVGVGNVTVTGTAPYVVEFVVDYAETQLVVVTDGSGLTGGTSPDAVATETVRGGIQYDAQPGWREMGGTREGLQLNVNNAEDSFDIDQILGAIGTAPNEWECNIQTRLAEMTLENLQFVWEGSVITEDLLAVGGPEREIGFAGATVYTERRVAAIFQKPNGKLRGYFFHRMVRAPQEGTLDHQKSGPAQTLQVQLRALADETETDPKKAFFIVRDQS